MNVSLIKYTDSPDALAGLAAATCTNATDSMKALQHALASGHESVIEHASFTFLVRNVSRALLAQLTRHRIASFSVLSQRYVDMSNANYVIPNSIIDLGEDAVNEYIDQMEQMQSWYREWRDRLGKDKQEDARMVLPEATCTSIMFTMNARELRHFFSLRLCNHAQWEIRKMARAMLSKVLPIAPVIFADAGPGCWRGACPEKRSCGNPPERVKIGGDPLPTLYGDPLPTTREQALERLGLKSTDEVLKEGAGK